MDLPTECKTISVLVDYQETIQFKLDQILYSSLVLTALPLESRRNGRLPNYFL